MKSKGQSRQKGQAKSIPSLNKTELPESYKKSDCVYVNGVITESCRGIFTVDLDNEMKALATSRRMENLRVSLMVGDNVTVEIPLLGLNPADEKQKGRIVWRIRN